jgi:hypothetical protein
MSLRKRLLGGSCSWPKLHSLKHLNNKDKKSKKSLMHLENKRKYRTIAWSSLLSVFHQISVQRSLEEPSEYKV